MGEPSSELTAKLNHMWERYTSCCISEFTRVSNLIRFSPSSDVNEGEAAPVQKGHGTNVYLEFTEFSRWACILYLTCHDTYKHGKRQNGLNCFRKEIKDLEKKFKEYCCPQSQKIGLTELKVEIVHKLLVNTIWIELLSTWWRSWGLLKTTSPWKQWLARLMKIKTRLLSSENFSLSSGKRRCLRWCWWWWEVNEVQEEFIFFFYEY